MLINKSSNKILILDGFYLIFRSYYAMFKSHLIGPNNEKIGALYGFIKTILSLIERYQPDYLLVVLDKGGSDYRRSIYPEYKANRSEVPDDLELQISYIIDFLNHSSIQVISKQGFEADDLIASISHKLRKQNYSQYLVSGDKDLLQLVDSNVTLCRINSKGFIDYTPNNIKDEFGVESKSVVDYLSLIGDSSDNIGGVKGVGPKTAIKILDKYENIDNILELLTSNSLTKQHSFYKLLNNSFDILKRNKLLIQTMNDLDIEFTPIKFNISMLSSDAAISLLKKYKFNSILASKYYNQSDKDQGLYDDINSVKHKYTLINTKEKFIYVKEEIYKNTIISFDLETTSLKYSDAKIIGYGISYKENEAYFIPIKNDSFDIKWDELNFIQDQEWLFNELKLICEDPTIKKIGLNIKYDYLVLRYNGIKLQGIIFDVMIAAHLYNNSYDSISMDYLALELLKYNTIKYNSLISKKDSNKTLYSIEFNKVLNYACEDVDITFKLYKLFVNLINSEPFKDLFYKVEVPLIEILSEIEYIGIYIDTNYFNSLVSSVSNIISETKENIFKISNEVFNLNSTKALATILYDKLKFRSSSKTRSTSAKVLESLIKLNKDSDIVNYILKYRTINKLKNTYIDSFLELISSKTKSIHTNFQQAFTQTGRLSSRNPNLQNIPLDNKFNISIRKGFIARPNKILVSLDYSQIELRILAHLSQDPNLLTAFKNNQDLHKETASILFKKPAKDISIHERYLAKQINFSIIYGIGAFTLSERLNISRDEAVIFIDSYFNHFSKVKDYIKNQIIFVQNNLYSETILGRKRYIKDIVHDIKHIRAHAERNAINSPIQGSSADIIKKTMVDIYNSKFYKDNDINLLLQIHDELLFEISSDTDTKVINSLKYKMENTIKLSVPLLVNIKKGSNWGDLL